MKILHVGSSLDAWGGIERYVAYLSDGLVARGHQVTVTCARCCPLDTHLNVPTLPIQVRRKFDFPAFSQYLRHFKQVRYDVVHTHFSPDYLLPAMAARMRRQPLSIMTRHVAFPWSRQKVRLYTTLFDHIIPVSYAVQRHLEASGVSSDKMTVAKAGCPALEPTRSREDMRRQLGIADSVVAIGSFGRLVIEKGVDTLIGASASMPENVSFEVFGDGPLASDLEGRARSAGARVKFHGYREDVPECIQAMEAVVVPSTCEEAFPYAVLEAMSVGRPVLASRVGGLPEIVEEGRTGLLFDKGDSAGLALLAIKVAGNPDLRGDMGLRAKHKHRDSYTVAQMAERIEAVYLAQQAKYNQP